MDLDITLGGKRLYRSNSNAWMFGVCGGIAENLHINPLVVRAVFVLLSFSVVVPILYIVLGLSIPSEALA